MANELYPKWKETIMQADADSELDSAEGASTGVFVALIDTGVYTYGAADEFWDEAGANDAIDGLVGTAMEITTKTQVNGLFDGDNVTFSSVSGATVEALIIYRKNAGAETTHKLVSYLDTGVTGLPVTPNGGDIIITWDASGIFQL